MSFLNRVLSNKFRFPNAYFFLILIWHEKHVTQPLFYVRSFFGRRVQRIGIKNILEKKKFKEKIVSYSAV